MQPKKPKSKPIPKVAKAKTKTRRKAVPPGLRWDLLEAAKFRCQACGVPASQARLEIDHVRPISKGGKDLKSNYQVLCLRCNRGKGAKLRKQRAGKKNPS
jgi:5-methylcytosine-specific restriction endonuclease McrA